MSSCITCSTTVVGSTLTPASTPTSGSRRPFECKVDLSPRLGEGSRCSESPICFVAAANRCDETRSCSPGGSACESGHWWSHHLLIGVLAVSVGVLTCCGSWPHARSIGRGDMPIVLFNFARNLKITRFTIDVLTQRLEHLELPRDGTSEEWSRFVGSTHESVAA